MEGVVVEGPDAYAQRAGVIRELATAIDDVRDAQTKAIMRDAMRRLILTMELPKAEAVKTPFVKLAKDA
jgi:hypothetical protein